MGSITLYSGRDEELISPLLEGFTAATGIEVEARYGGSAELALLIQTEGDNSPADVFISQSPGALGLLAGEGRLVTLDDELVGLVDRASRLGRHLGRAHRPGAGHRVQLRARRRRPTCPARSSSSPTRRYSGQVGVAPTNGSFQDFVTAMRNELGDDATAEWLEGMAANNAPNYPKNSAIVEAVGRGEVQMGWSTTTTTFGRSKPTRGASVNHFLPADDVGSLVIVTGGAVLHRPIRPTPASSCSTYSAQQRRAGRLR